MNTTELLRSTDDLLRRPPRGARRCWPRACAALLRIALERALRDYWTYRAPSLVGRPMRHQLLALQVLADVETAALARSAWHGLTRAMHHHTYELAPTAAELHGWRQEVTDLRYLLAQRRSSSEFVAESQSVSRELVQRYEAETTHEDSQTEAHLRDI